MYEIWVGAYLWKYLWEILKNVYILTMSLSMHYRFEQKKEVELTFTVTFKALYLNVPTLQGKGHKIRLQGRLKSKVTWSIDENAYSLWKHIMQNSNRGQLNTFYLIRCPRGINKQQPTQKVERQLLSSIRRFTFNKVFVALLSTCRPSYSHNLVPRALSPLPPAPAPAAKRPWHGLVMCHLDSGWWQKII